MASNSIQQNQNVPFGGVQSQDGHGLPMPGQAGGSNTVTGPPGPIIGAGNSNTGPSSANTGSPTGPGSFSSRRYAPEPNKRALYVGGLDATVTEDVLREIFETAVGHVVAVKLIPDRGNRNKGKYAFVDFDDPAAAEEAINILNGCKIQDKSIMTINWAYQNSNTPTKPDTSQDAHVFVGDLSNEVTDDILLQAFSAFGQVSEARVMWDMKTGRSRGYGFVAYPNREQADKAIASMNGEWLGARAIRCNWANQKGQPPIAHQPLQEMPNMPASNFNQTGFNFSQTNNFDSVVNQTPLWQTTCYVGNLTPYTTQNDLVPLFRNFGYVVEARFQSDRGFAFIKMDSHENAAMAIVQLNGFNVNGRPLKCSWGKDRPPNAQYENYNNGPAGSNFSQSNMGFFPQYNGLPGPVTTQGTATNNQNFQMAGNGFAQGSNPNAMAWAPSSGQNGFGYNNLVPMN